jgi:hypothetical protein
MKESNKCKFCNEIENASHIMFQCPIVEYVRSVIREGLEWNDKLIILNNFWCVNTQTKTSNSNMTFLLGSHNYRNSQQQQATLGAMRNYKMRPNC